MLGLTREQSYTQFEHRHYNNFEKALAESDVRVFIYDNVCKGEYLITKGTELHPVTIGNLVSFHKLNRAERRHLAKHYAAC